jgi:flagellar basal-body rod modification protein FlgD
VNVNSTAATDGGITTTSTSSKRDSGLGQDAFLKMLLTQLQHQDPTRPMADTEFIAQLAQFSSLEKLTEISQSVKALTEAVTTRASSLATDAPAAASNA